MSLYQSNQTLLPDCEAEADASADKLKRWKRYQVSRQPLARAAPLSHGRFCQLHLATSSNDRVHSSKAGTSIKHCRSCSLLFSVLNHADSGQSCGQPNKVHLLLVTSVDSQLPSIFSFLMIVATVVVRLLAHLIDSVNDFLDLSQASLSIVRCDRRILKQGNERCKDRISWCAGSLSP